MNLDLYCPFCYHGNDQHKEPCRGRELIRGHDEPEIGSKWIRKPNPEYYGTRMTYTVLAITEERKHYSSAVIYKGRNGKIWYKRLSDQWPGSLEPA